MDRPNEKNSHAEFRQNRSRRPQPQVLITPLIDIVFLLLVFFMLIARFLNPGIAVALPQSGSGEFDDSSSRTVVIESDGKIYLENTQLPLEEITARLSDLRLNGEIETVRLRGDREVEWQLVVSAMDAIRDAGIFDIVIETDAEPVR